MPSSCVGCHQNVNIKAYEQISESWTRRKVATVVWSTIRICIQHKVHTSYQEVLLRSLLVQLHDVLVWKSEVWHLLEWHISFPREKTQVFRNVSDQCNSWGCFAFCEIMLSNNKVILSQPRFLLFNQLQLQGNSVPLHNYVILWCYVCHQGWP